MGFVTEFKNHVIRVAGVTNSISTSQQHLEWNVGYGLTEQRQSFPGALVQKTKRNVKRCTLEKKEEIVQRLLPFQ